MSYSPGLLDRKAIKVDIPGIYIWQITLGLVNYLSCYLEVFGGNLILTFLKKGLRFVSLAEGGVILVLLPRLSLSSPTLLSRPFSTSTPVRKKNKKIYDYLRIPSTDKSSLGFSIKYYSKYSYQ